MKKISLFFVTLVMVMGLAVSGCYYERANERREYRHHHDRGYRHHNHHDYGHYDRDRDHH
jgi:ABC-type nickel/cobalt efflux system permease component RcnA